MQLPTKLFRLCGSHQVQFRFPRGIRRALRWLSNHAIVLFRRLFSPPIRRNWDHVSIRVKDQFTGFIAGVGDYGASGHGVGLPPLHRTRNLIKTEWRKCDFGPCLEGFELSTLFLWGEWMANECPTRVYFYFALLSPIGGGCQ